jgi:hypothetical protein
MKKTLTVLWATLGAAILFVWLVPLIPMPQDAKFSAAQLTAITLIHIGAAVIFIMGTAGFKRELKTAYILISVASVALALGTLQFPIIGALNAFDSPWVKYGGVDTFFITTGIFNYLGVRRFARLVGVRGWLTGFGWVVLFWVLAAGASVVLPSERTDFSGGPFHASVAVYTFELATIVITTSLVYRIRQLTSALYHKALSLLLASYLIVVAAGALHVTTFLFVSYDHWYTTKAVGSLPYIISGALLLLAGVEFNRIRFAEKLQPATTKASSSSQKASKRTAIDVITTVAALASNPSAIDPLLDEVRAITSQLGPQQTLSEAQQAKLADVYLKLESFLVNKEPVRQFREQDLRQMIEVRFKGSMHEPAFWNRLKI